jgi:uncharacterized protein involved in response to NO
MSFNAMKIRSILAAPHRMFFSVGMLYLVLASGWWFAVQLGRAGLGASFEPPVPGLLSHGAIMLFLVFTPFMFGFLATVFPRWQPAPELRAGLCMAVFSLLLLALPFLLTGLYVSQALFVLGWLLYCSGWTLLLGGLFASWISAKNTVPHSAGVLTGLAAGLLASLGFAWMLLEKRFDFWPYIRSLGLWGFLIAVFFTVSHRMVPFFTSCVIKDYRIWRPDWMLTAFVALALSRAVLEMHPALAWIPSLGMAGIALTLALKWRPRVKHGNRLLGVLHISFAWLALGLVLQLAQDIGAGLGVHWLGRAPLHALSMGFIGGMLVSMVSRVTMGHSGRPLALGGTGWWIFLATQLGAATRVAAEVLTAQGAVLNLAAALVWSLSLTGWALKFGPVYLQPRVDGRPG